MANSDFCPRCSSLATTAYVNSCTRRECPYMSDITDLQAVKGDARAAQLRQMKEGIAMMQEQAEIMREYYAIEGAILKSRYDMLIEAGFDEEQAMAMIMTKGIHT